ncbi:MAG TPA: hypothetical protein DEA08_06465 [Planctomycetes bacterium]|nr:hypothetical protein [Planctomycetota bacterium]
MAPLPLQLEIQGNQSHFRFDVPGAFEPRLEPVWKDAADPPEITEVREVWEIPGARLVASDGRPETFWKEWRAFLARLRVRGQGFPLWVRLVRDPGGAAQTVWTLGAPDHERFKIEELSASSDELAPTATWRILAPVTLVVSAVQRFADPNGIVGWDQEVRSSYDAGGLHALEWQTTLTTREGVDAVDKARRFGRIDIAPFGGSYSYATNGPDGVEVVTSDADEPNQRTPTSCTVLSRIKQWGVHVGTTSPGSSPTEVGYSVRTRAAKDERSTTYRATARGPGALAWVEGRRPGGPIETAEVLHEEAIRYAEGTWVVKEPAPDQPDAPEGVRWQIQAEITGGHVDFDFEPVVGGFQPVLFEGAILPWRLSLTLKGRRRGGEGKPEELKLPGLLSSPWLLDRNASREKAPFVAEFGADPDSHLWAREASLVYWSASKPTGSPAAQVRAAQPVESYYL